MNLDTIATIASVPAIIALVTLAKDLGLPSRLSPLLAVLLGVTLSLFADFGTDNTITDWYTPISMGIILGLSAAGLYDGAKAVGGSRTASTVVVNESRPAALPGETREAYRARTGLELPE